MPAIRQTNFGAGELGPGFWGRTDLAKYSSGLRLMRNAFPLPAGAAVNRPGTTLSTSRAGKDHAQAAWLVPFVFSELPNQAYAIELGHLYARFVVNGAYVAPDQAQYDAWSGATTYALGDWIAYGGVAYRSLQAANLNHQPDVSPTWWEASTVYEIVTPYAAADLARIQYAQQGDVVTLTRHGYTPRELKRFAHAKWTISAVSFDVPQSSCFWWTFDFCADPLQAADATHPARPWIWLVTTLERDERGFIFETAPKEVGYYHGGGIPPARTALPFERVVYPDKPVRISRYNNGGLIAIPDATTQIVGYRLYRGQGKKWMGFVNESPGPESSEPWIYDDGQTPDYSDGPPMARNPFKVFGIQGEVEVLLRTEEPACVCFHQQRRVFANLAVGATPYRPATVLASALDHYALFDEHTVAKDEDAVEFTPVSRLREEVRWVLGAQRLLVGTSQGVWSAAGAGGAPLAPTVPTDAQLQSEDGSSWLLPIVAGDQVLYVTARGNAVRELAYDDVRGKFLGQPLSLLAEHLFRGLSIVDWAYQREPHSIIWAVRSDGRLLSLTYMRALDAWGWAWHDLADGGAAESICAIPEGDEDAIYLVVRRTVGGQTKRYIERLASRRVEDARLGVFLDSALSYDGRNTGATTVTVTELAAGGYDVGVLVTVTASAAAFVAGDVGNEVVLNPDALRTLAADGKTVLDAGTVCRLRITGYTSATEVTAEVLTPAVPAVYQATATTRWARAVDELSGLEHLEGKTVVALADGNVVRENAGVALVVTGGAVTLPEPAAVIHVGLSYASELELLDVGGPADLRGKEKVVKKVVVELEKSRGLRVGKDLSSLTLWNQRQVQDGYGPIPLFTGRAEVLVAGEWSKHGRAAVQQADPLPMTVVAVTREVEVG